MKSNVFRLCSGVAVLYFLFVTHVVSREIDLSANLHKNLKQKLGPKPVEKPVSPYFVRILKRRPNYIIEDADEKEIESIPRVLIDKRKNRLIPLQPVLVDNSTESSTSEVVSMEKDVTMEESSSNLSTTSSFLPVIGGIFVAAEAEENATIALSAPIILNSSEAPSRLLQLLVEPGDASRLTTTNPPLPTTTVSPSPNPIPTQQESLQLQDVIPVLQDIPDETTAQPTTIALSTNAPTSSTSTSTTSTTISVSTSTTAQPTTETTTPTTPSTTTTTTTPEPTTTTTQPTTTTTQPTTTTTFKPSTTTTLKTTTTTTTTTTPPPTTTTTTTTVGPTRSNIKLVQTNQIEVLTFPTTSKPLFTQPRQQNTWTLFQPLQPNNNFNLNNNKNNINGNLNSNENNPINAILAAPGNFIMGMFKGIQQATEFFGDTITGFANILLPKKN